MSKIKKDILCSVNFFSKNRAVFEIILLNMIEQEKQHMTI